LNEALKKKEAAIIKYCSFRIPTYCQSYHRDNPCFKWETLCQSSYSFISVVLDNNLLWTRF